MTSSLDMIRGRQVVQTLTNQSGGAIIAGDVVIVSAANDESFTTTTSAAYNSTRVGVAQESIAVAATGRILLEGYAPLVNVSASATRGHYLLTHTVAKQATSQAGYAAGAFGQILKAGTTPSAMIFPVAQVGSAGVARSGSTTGDHLAVWNGSNADSIKDGGVGVGVQIAQVVLGADAGDITISSIPATYTNLRLDFQGRGTKAAAYTELRMQFNGDTAANYNQERSSISGATNTIAEGIGLSNFLIGYIAAASATAGGAGSATINIQNYAGTTFWKQITSHNTVTLATTTGNQWMQLVSGMWASTAAINSIKLSPDANNFLAGTVATLYGLI